VLAALQGNTQCSKLFIAEMTHLNEIHIRLIMKILEMGNVFGLHLGAVPAVSEPQASVFKQCCWMQLLSLIVRYIIFWRCLQTLHGSEVWRAFAVALQSSNITALRLDSAATSKELHCAIRRSVQTNKFGDMR
jgi:hypothetical protein